MSKTKKQNKFWQTAVITVLIVSIIGVSAPQPAAAVFPTESWIKNAYDVAVKIWDKIEKYAKTAAGTAIKKALRGFLAKLAYDTAVWIGSGDEKQKPLIFTKDAGEYMRDAGDAALGEFLDTFAELKGLPNLCNLPSIPALQFQTLFAEPEKPDCTFSEIMDEVSGLYDSAFEAMQGSAASLMSDPKRVTLYIENEYKGEGVMDTFLKAVEMGTGYESLKKNEAQLDRLTQGTYKAVKDKIAGTIKTPAEDVKDAAASSKEKATEAETTFTGEIFADAVSTFTSTLISQLLKRMMSGMFSYATESDVSSSVSGSSQVALGGGSESAKGRSGGIAAAKEQFASFQTVSFTAAGVVNILNDFASCPDAGAQVTNCVISDSFRQAIEEKMTLKEAVDQSVISPDTPFAFTAEGAITDPQKGLPYRGVKVLKQYSVVPVGWELAAEFINDFGSGSQTIGSLMDAYTKCGPEAENYSPFCGLVDPSWVLKAPEVFCKKKGFGETLGADYYSDSDSHPMTPEKRNVVRTESCTDTQSCLSEDATGKCEAYGYCAKQRRIYRFQGTECPAYEASCEVYADTESGEEAAYLSNTLNNNDCNADNASCQWYCSKYDTSTQTFTCTNQDDGAIYFDRDASECEEDDSGCNEFISVKGGANLFFNPSFEQYSGTIDDNSDSDTFAYNLEGNPCSGFEEKCYGWRFGDGAQGQAVATASSGGVGLKLPSTGYIAQIPDTGSPITNRSFILSYDYRNLSSSSCEGKMWFRDGASSTASTTKEFEVTYEPSDQFQRVSNLYTFPDDDYLGTPFVYSAIGAVTGCEVVIDNIKLEENSAASNYADYGASLVYVNTEKASQCSVSDIGCELYTPRTGESDYQIPGIITNALSTICTDANGNADYDNPECSQCPQEYVGCDSYIEGESLYDAPIKDEMGFGGPDYVPTDDLRKAIGKRKGQYCDNNQDNSCLSDSDCAGGASCIQATSIIPEEGDDCSVAEVGCEEYVNLDKQGEGGEVLEYYTLIKQCVKPTEAQKTDGELNTYYTFEGSDQSGYQLRTWYLKKSDKDAGPCTHLDLYGTSAESSEADCIDSTEGVLDCQANFGSDPDCLLFYDADGNEYYRPQSAIITVSDDCHPLRNSLDERIYYSIPDESESCSAGANRCREYKGSQGSKVEIILNETFDKSVWEGGELSSVVVTAGNGQSMAIGDDTASHSENASITIGNSLEQGASYIVSFWAKHSGSSVEPLYAFIVNNGSNLFYFNDDSNNDGLQLTSNWQRYFLGPVVIDTEITADDKFAFKYEGSLVYIDNVELQKNTDSYYLVAGSAPQCMGYEGCEEYKDSNKNKHYLKSFTKLCDANLVGCQSLLTTENSTTPFPTTYNSTNEFTSDDVFVDADHPVAYPADYSRSMYVGNGVNGIFFPVGWEATRQTYVVNKKTMCNSEAAGCDRFGLPQEDETGNFTYSQIFWINDPDTYSSTLCQEQQLQCREYESSEGSTVYFKDPQEKICTYDSGSGSWKKPDGSECPLQNDDPAAVPSQPKGPVCKDGLRKDKLCNSDFDCPNSGGTTFSRCDSEGSEDFGWVGACTPENAGCTQYFDPLSENNNELPNSDFESDVEDNSDPSASPDDVPDNWNLLTTASTNFKPNISTFTSFCTFQQSTDHVFEGKRAAYVGSGTGAYCLTGSEDVIPVDENSYYTLSGNVFLSLANSNFSIGLLYYDANGAELNAGTDPQSYAIAAYEGASRSANNPPDTGEWHRFAATIGPNLEREFPAGTAFIKVFLEFSSSSATQTSLLFFDNISFSENDQYTYIDNTVDGAPESEQNTCNGEVVMEDECVAFREATNKNLVYLSTIEEEKESAVANSTEFVTEICTFNSGLESAACNSRKNTADTNVVIKVENDRECAEWLSCSSSRISYDASGNEVGTTCLDIGTCTKRNEDTGICTEWRTKKQNIGGGDDRMIISQAGDTWELKSARNVAGYSTVGINWQGGSCSSGTCSGGALNASTCSNNDDCNPIIQGYYPYDWMPQKGLGGSGSIKEMVPDNDFEDVFCDGEADYAALSQYENISSVERSRDLGLRCSLDRHCRTRDIDNTVSALLKEANSKANVQSLYYEEGWCDNVDGQTIWKDWSTIGEDATSKATMQIIDYDPNEEYEKDDRQGTISALSLDLNNNLFVQPANNGFSGVAVDLKDMIVPDQEYTLSFDAQYVGSPNTETDFIQIGIEHTQPEVAAVVNNIVDLVFVLDVSASMDDYIANVSAALQTLADNLDVANIQARYAIVTTGPNNNNPHVLDYDDYTDYGPYFGSSDGITKDFTTDADEFKQALDDIVNNFGSGFGGHEDNYEALVNIANNQFSLDNNYALNFSTDAPKFVVLLSDQYPEASDPYVQGHTNATSWDEGDEDALISGVLSSKPYELHVVTLSSGDAHNSYDELASFLNGGIYDIALTNYASIFAAISASIEEAVEPEVIEGNIEYFNAVTENTTTTEAQAGVDVVLIYDLGLVFYHDFTNVPFEIYLTDIEYLLDPFINNGLQNRYFILSLTNYLSTDYQYFILDFDDYNMDENGYLPYYGSDDGISRGYTEDEDELKEVLQNIADDPKFISSNSEISNTASPLNAIADLAANSFPDYNNYAFEFRNNASKAALFLSDAYTGFYYFNELLDGSLKENSVGILRLYAIASVNLDPLSYNNSILEVIDYLGGDYNYDYKSILGDPLCIYDIDSCPDIFRNNYTEIGERIIDQATTFTLGTTTTTETSTEFQFDENYKRYTLGPLTIEHKASANDTSKLFFAQTNGSSNVPFVIDDISLKPTLEVNTQGSPNGEGSPWEISRDCRAYPEQKSLSCDYKNDASGVIYEGWKGYCLAKDPMDSKQCIAWWPVDIIAGERDLTNRLTVRYSGKYPVYQCLVAKGNANLGACEDDGTLCSSNNDCWNDKCLGNGTSGYSETYPMSDNDGNSKTAYQPHHVETEEYRLKRVLPFFGLECIYTNSSLTQWDCYIEGQSYDRYTHFAKFEANDVEKAVHISEIDSISFDKGDMIASMANDRPINDSAWYTTGPEGYDTKILETNATSEDAPLIAYGKAEKDNIWYGYTIGIWCGEEVCTQSTIGDYLDKEINVTYFVLLGSESSVNYGCGANTTEECEIFNHFSEEAAPYFDLTEDSLAWNTSDGNHCQGNLSNHAEYTTMNCSGKKGGASVNHFDLNGGSWGASYKEIYLSRVKFENGYLDSYYYGFNTSHPTSAEMYIQDVQWTFNLKEPCLLAVEGVSKEAETIPWYTRVREGSSYIVPGLGYGYKMLGGQSKVYGSMGNDPRNVTPDKIDGDEEEFKDETQLIDWTASAPDNLPLVYANSGVGSSLPYACIGDCGALVCEDNYDIEQTPYGEVACEKNLWIGAGSGYCSKPNPDNGQQELCTKKADGTATGCTDPEATCETSEHSNSGVGSNNNSYTEQLVAAAKEGWSRYRLLFADIGDTVWYAPQDPEDSSRFLPYLTALGKTSLGTTSEKPFDEDDDGINDFKDSTTMKECPNATRDPSEYCGIRPSIDNIELAIDDKTNADVDGTLEVPNGSAAKLIFDSYANEDQVPIEKIRIAWESTSSNPANFNDNPYIIDPWEASPSNNHTYTHVYTCDPTSSYYSKTDTACVYYIHIQLEDHWKFCSGEKQTTIKRSTEGSCTSYDTFDPKIIVKP